MGSWPPRALAQQPSVETARCHWPEKGLCTVGRLHIGWGPPPASLLWPGRAGVSAGLGAGLGRRCALRPPGGPFPSSHVASWNSHPLGFAIFTHPEPSGLHGDASKQQTPGGNDVTFPFLRPRPARHWLPGPPPTPPSRPRWPRQPPRSVSGPVHTPPGSSPSGSGTPSPLSCHRS